MAQWKSIGDVPGIIERLNFQGFGCWMQAWLVKRSMAFCQNWVHGITYVGQWCVPIGLKKRLGCQKSALLVCFHAPIFGGLPSVVPATFLDDGWVGCADSPWNGLLATRPSRREETRLSERRSRKFRVSAWKAAGAGHGAAVRTAHPSIIQNLNRDSSCHKDKRRCRLTDTASC